MVPNPNLPDFDSLRPYLDIPSINTGLHRPLTAPSGIVTDDVEGLNAITDEHGSVMLQSGIEFTQHVYRGQPEEHVPCLSTLGRLKNSEEQLLALCRNAAFEDALGEHPFVRLCRQARFLGHPLRVDTQGLAQHYGLATDLLDFTSNFDVASFFAVCYWDHEKLEYRPVVDTEKPGVIYRIVPAFLVGTNLGADFEIVGWQPLKRPEQQRAFGLKMKKGMDLNMLPFVQIVKFRHCAKISNRIWKSFDDGRSLFPDDAAGELAKRAETLCRFTRQQVDRAWDRLDSWNENRTTNDYRLAVEGKSEIHLSETTILDWEGLAVERDGRKLSSRLREVLNKVRYRRAAYPA
jgi:hypothetical protein